MKKKNLLLLSLVALSITACGKNSTNSTTNGNSTSVVQSDKTSTSTKKSDTSTTTSTTTSQTDSTSEVTSDDYESSKWPTSVKDDMIQYLDNTLLPYIDLGITDVKSSWDSDTTTLEIHGKASTTALTSDEISSAEKIYKKYGWTVTTDSTSMTAKNEDETITVKYHNNEYYNVLEAKYDEPFDESKAATTWPSKIVEEMNTNLNNHGGDVPYVYLGSVNPTYSWDSDHVTFKITGGKWDDKITALAKTAFEAANASIQNVDYKWVIEEIGTNIYGKTFNASIKLSDGTKLAVSIEAPDSDAGKKAYMNIVYTKPFSGTSTEWPADITDWEEEYTHNHTIPFFYCGSESKDIAVTSQTSNTLRFYGEDNSWDDGVIDNFKNAINKENTSIATDAEKWVITSKQNDSDASDTAYIAIRTFADGCQLSIQVQKDSSNKRADILVTYEQGYIPTATEWGDDVKDLFTEYLDGNTIPYIYLGQDADLDNGNWDDLKTLTIYGGNYYKALIEGANNVLSSTTGWTSSIVTKTGTNYEGTAYSYNVVEAEYIIDATTGKKLNVTVKAEYYNTNTGEASERSIIEVVYEKPYIVPTDPSELQWNYVEGDEYCTATQIKNFLGGHTLPFVYLNAKDVDVITDPYESAIYLTGGLWDDKVLTHALSQITGSTKTTEEGDDGNTQDIVTATLTEDDGCTIDITIHNVYGQIEYKAVLSEKYNNNPSVTAWDSETATTMSTGLNGKTLPFINLGATHPTVESGTNFFKIETHVWDEEILTNAVSSINGVDGWTCIKNEFAEDEVDAFKVFDDGSKVYFKINNLGSGTQLIVSVNWVVKV